MDWFEALTGFRELSYKETQSKLSVDGNRLISLVNGRSRLIGEFEMPSLSELRSRAAGIRSQRGKANVRVVQGDVRKMHTSSEYAGALFQVASQFNALEMTGPDVSPEDGVTRYQHDRTQGPACAIAAGSATIYRNYFAPVNGSPGQTTDRQLNGLSLLGLALRTDLGMNVADLWVMKNGYALCSRAGLDAISAHLKNLDAEQIDDLRGRVSIAVQRNVEVTETGAPAGQLVSQAFCSALPVAYSNVSSGYWRSFATLVLEAAYEATLLEASLNVARRGSNIVLLTLLGGGAFGNESKWIYSAIRHALRRVEGHALDIRIVSYGSPPRELLEFAASLAR